MCRHVGLSEVEWADSRGCPDAKAECSEAAGQEAVFRRLRLRQAASGCRLTASHSPACAPQNSSGKLNLSLPCSQRGRATGAGAAVHRAAGRGAAAALAQQQRPRGGPGARLCDVAGGPWRASAAAGGALAARRTGAPALGAARYPIRQCSSDHLMTQTSLSRHWSAPKLAQAGHRKGHEQRSYNLLAVFSACRLCSFIR